MGVPKFYRWISERYPCLSEVITDDQIPEFDNLYLDMNGIIHGCTHPDNDDELSFKIPEEQVFCEIFNYVDALFAIIKPKKVFFMAIDGVAPRAKMNQQRARRFMSAKNAEALLMKAEKKQTVVSKEMLFDSNCITPGTEFMARLHEQLQFFVKMKITTDTCWQGLRIYYSGHNCPGEGEHKIMDFIRSERSRLDYDPNTRHCLYGLDADLIMLGMCSHEPHFALLREEVKFGRPKKKTFTNVEKQRGPSEITFHLLHLSLLREYIYWEFASLEDKLPFPFDLDAIIDDWVLMGFFVGNDFIPHLPHVHIHEDALPLLYETYIKVLPLLDGYMNESGTLNLKRFEIFLKNFSKNDKKNFVEMMDDEAYISSKSRPDAWKAKPRNDAIEIFEDLEAFSFPTTGDACTESDKTVQVPGAFATDSEDVLTESDVVPDCYGLISATEVVEGGLSGLHLDSDEGLPSVPLDDSDYENDCENYWTPAVDRAFKIHKRDYYSSKLKYSNISKEELREQAEGYIRALQWNLHYYYHGCCSWSWYYSHHYAPYISDVVDFANMEMNFDLNEPFHPFEQLLAVLPAASADCLPVALQGLMHDPSSPIIDFYPKEFETDLDGKKNDWEAVVLIPFIREDRLLNAVASRESQLSEEEKIRNSVGPHLLYTYDPGRADYVQSSLSNVFPDLQRCTALVQEIDKDEFRISRNCLVHGLLPGVRLDLVFPGFPTMKHIPHHGELHFAAIKVFQQPSRKQSMILKIHEREEFYKDKLELASCILGSEVHVNWPILMKAIVQELWTPTIRFRTANEKVVCDELDEVQKQSFCGYEREAKRNEYERRGISVGQWDEIALVRLVRGLEYSFIGGSMVPVRHYCNDTVPVSLRLLVQNAMEESDRPLSTTDAYPVGAHVFVKGVGSKYYGYEAIIHENHLSKKGTLTLLCSVPPSGFDFLNLAESCSRYSFRWYSPMELARMVHVSVDVVNRITGCVLVAFGETNNSKTVNIGLSLKFSKRNRAVADYSRRTAQGFWEYSPKTVALVRDYHRKFGEVFRCIHKADMHRGFIASDVLFSYVSPDCRTTRLEEILKYLKEVTPPLGCMYANDSYADSRVIQRVMYHLQGLKSGPKPFTKRLAVRARAVFRPELCKGDLAADPSTEFRLLDRVICVKKLPNAPLGAFGTVIGLVSNKKIEVMFDKPFAGGQQIRGAQMRCAQVRSSALINLNHGKRFREKKFTEKRVVRTAAPTCSNPPVQMHTTSHHSEIMRNNTEKPTNTTVAFTSNQVDNFVGKVRILVRKEDEVRPDDVQTQQVLTGTEVNSQNEKPLEDVCLSAVENVEQKTSGETKVITELSVARQNSILAKLFVNQVSSEVSQTSASVNTLEKEQQEEYRHVSVIKAEESLLNADEIQEDTVLRDKASSTAVALQVNDLVRDSSKNAPDFFPVFPRGKSRRKHVRGGFCTSIPKANSRIDEARSRHSFVDDKQANPPATPKMFRNKYTRKNTTARRSTGEGALLNRGSETPRIGPSWGRPPTHFFTQQTSAAVAIIRPIPRSVQFNLNNMTPTQVMRKKMNPSRPAEPNDLKKFNKNNVPNMEKNDSAQEKGENTSESLGVLLKKSRPRKSRIAAKFKNVQNNK